MNYKLYQLIIVSKYKKVEISLKNFKILNTTLLLLQKIK
jgi:hypothetical protein